MRTSAKLGAYGLVLAAAFGGGAALGTAVGPIDVGGGTSHESPGDAPDHTTDDVPTTEQPDGEHDSNDH